jgi:hypothetical protein
MLVCFLYTVIKLPQELFSKLRKVYKETENLTISAPKNRSMIIAWRN